MSTKKHVPTPEAARAAHVAMLRALERDCLAGGSGFVPVDQLPEGSIIERPRKATGAFRARFDTSRSVFDRPLS